MRQLRRAGALSELSPRRLAKQIVLLQSAYYAVAVVLILFTTLVAGKRFGPELILDWRSVRGDTAVGWTLGLCWFLDSAIGVIFILILVSRSKLVLDFALTIHLVNLILTWLYTGAFPSGISWWVLQVMSATLMTTLGIWACQWRELQPMAFGGHGTRDAEAQRPQQGGGPVREGNVSRALRGLLHTAGMAQEEARGDYEMVPVERQNPA